MLAKYQPHMIRTLLVKGVPLFVALMLGVAVEAWLRGPEFIPDFERVDLTLVGEMISLVVAVVRLAIPVIGAFVAIPILVSTLFQKIYAVKDLDKAHNALNRVIFGKLGRRPLAIVGKGQILVGKDSFHGRVGGPATLVTYNDNAVVTEQYGRIKRVLGAGLMHDLERFERVWEIIDLRPQHWVYPVFAMTKEGIPIYCEADLSFQIDDSPGEREWPVHTGGLYPYSEEAVFKAATSVWIREPDHPEHKRTWIGRVVIGFAEGLLRNILAEYRLDWLLAPPRPGQNNPREEIREQLEEGLRAWVGKVGAKIVRVDIGPIEVRARDGETTEKLNEIIPKQHVAAWYAEWEARALEDRAEKEAALLRMDVARVQAQAEVIVEIVESLQNTIATRGVTEPYILAVRLVESLRWVSYNAIQHDFMPSESAQRLKRMNELLGVQIEEPQGEKKEESEAKKGES